MRAGNEARLARLLAGSYLKLTGRPLAPEDLAGEDLARWLYEAPFGLLVHDTSPDPLFVYANRKAQEIFGYTRDEFTGLPSRLSAGVQDRESRRLFMDAVRRDGVVDGYRGPRVRKDGRQFWLEDATVWNVLDTDSSVVGQAALIRRWSDPGQ
ncbi:MEKHLA domain-containing protein [Actinoplanes sp. NPDC000266]